MFSKAPFFRGDRKMLTCTTKRSIAFSFQRLMSTVMFRNGPIAASKPHVVKFGLVAGQTRGKDASLLINPPIERVDELYWLRDDSRQSQAVLDHIKEENAFAKRRTASQESLRNKLIDENISLLQENRDSLPFTFEKHARYAYFERERKGFPYKMYCRVSRDAFDIEKYISRRRTNPESEIHSTHMIPGGEVILDVNQLAKSSSSNFCAVSTFQPHPADDSVIAYSIDNVGHEVYDIRFTGKGWKSIGNTSGEFEWSSDGSRLFYITKDDAHRPNKVWMRRTEDNNQPDICLFEEIDKLWEVTLQMSLCKSFLVIHTSSTETTEMHLLRTKDFGKILNSDMVKPFLQCVRKRDFGCRYFGMPHPNGYLYLLSNRGATNNLLLRFPLDSTVANEEEIFKQFEECEVLVSHQSSRYLQEIKIFKGYLVVYGREDGLGQIWTLPIQKYSSKLLKVSMPDTIYSIKLSKKNHVFDTDRILLNYSNPGLPMVKVCLELRSHEIYRLSETRVPDYNPMEYGFHRFDATSFDGTKIHMSVIMPKGTQKNTKNRVIMLGYGAYGDTTEPRFRSRWLPYLRRGMICCIAHVRGGAENGNMWYEVGGKYLTKRNTFMDFIACAEFLIQQGWTTPRYLAIEGRSAGGLLIGAVLNMRPDLFQVAVANVPFVDVMTTMSDSSIPLTAGEWEEWGNPNEYRFHDYMLSYSPIDNVRAQNYPHVLILGGLNDHRVQYWEPLKWASKLRASTTGENDIILKIDTDAGHFSASDRYRHLDEVAFQQAYVISKLFSEEETDRQRSD